MVPPLSTLVPPPFDNHWAGCEHHSMSHVSCPPPPCSETLANKLAAKLVREHATEGHTSRTWHISGPSATQALMESNRKRPAVPLHIINQKKRRPHEDVAYPTEYGWCRNPQMQPQDAVLVPSKLGSPKGTPRLSTGPSAVALFQLLPAEIMTIVFDLAINSEFHHFREELTQRNVNACQPPVMPSVLSSVCKQWNPNLMSRPSM